MMIDIITTNGTTIDTMSIVNIGTFYSCGLVGPLLFELE